jgi:hypothetical protein
VARMRAIKQSAAAAYSTNAPSRRSDGKPLNKKEEDKKKGKKGLGRRDKDNKYSSYRPKEQFNRIVAKKVYAKYFKSNYKLNNATAPCKDKKKTLFSVFKSLFIVNKEDKEDAATLKGRS